MFARVGIFHSTPERVDDDEARRAREQMLQTLQGLAGFAGLYVLGTTDRQNDWYQSLGDGGGARRLGADARRHRSQSGRGRGPY